MKQLQLILQLETVLRTGTNCFSVLDHFVGLVLKGLMIRSRMHLKTFAFSNSVIKAVVKDVKYAQTTSFIVGFEHFSYLFLVLLLLTLNR